MQEEFENIIVSVKFDHCIAMKFMKFFYLTTHIGKMQMSSIIISIYLLIVHFMKQTTLILDLAKRLG
jgi:hypothetical protein